MNLRWIADSPSLKTPVGIAVWLAASLSLSVIFFQEFWAALPLMLSPAWVLGGYHASPWAVLALCLAFLWVKRRAVRKEMGLGVRGLPALAGVAAIAGAVLMPATLDYLVFQVLLASLGVLAIVFGKASRIPFILLAIYGFAISFPLAVERFAAGPYAETALAPLLGLLNRAGYPLHRELEWVHFTARNGEPIAVTVTTGCAGPATMGVFVALFALMTLDTPQRPRKAAWLFLFGAAGTWFQSLARLVIVLLSGYYLGEDALWVAHSWTIYIVFPLWYLVFAYVYLRQSGRRPPPAPQDGGPSRSAIVREAASGALAS